MVILSSSQEERDIAAAYRLGAKAYLVKPVEPSKLQGMVRAINDFWLIQNTPPPTTCFQRGAVLATAGQPAISVAALSQYPSQTNI